MDFSIVGYDPAMREAFKAINLAWITEYFEVEPIDLRVLDDPESYILAPGGHIFFARDERTGEVLGTCALIKQDDGSFELAKMGVLKSAQGRGVGKALGEYAMRQADELGAPYVELLSNRKLTPALNLYTKLGFVETPMPATEYKRADIRMVRNSPRAGSIVC